MSTGGWLVIGALAVAVVGLAGAVVQLRGRLTRAEQRSAALDRYVRGPLSDELAGVRSDARSAALVARRAAGLDDPPPRVALEPVTGRLIKAVAMGAGARRALGRFARRDFERQERKAS